MEDDVKALVHSTAVQQEANKQGQESAAVQRETNRILAAQLEVIAETLRQLIEQLAQIKMDSTTRTSSTIRRQLWEEIHVSVSACGNQVRTLKNCRKKIDDIRRNLKNAIQFGRRHASGTGGGPPASPITLTPLEEMLRDKMLPVVISGLHGDRDIGVYPQIFPPVTPVPPNNQEEVLTSDSSLASSILEGIASEQHQSPIVTQAATLPPANNTQETLKAMDASESRISVLHIKHHQELMGVHQCMAVEMHKIQELICKIPEELHVMNQTLRTLVTTLQQGNNLVPQSARNEGLVSDNNQGMFHGGILSPQTDVFNVSSDDISQVRSFVLESPTADQMQTSSTDDNLRHTPKRTTKRKRSHTEIRHSLGCNTLSYPAKQFTQQQGKHVYNQPQTVTVSSQAQTASQFLQPQPTPVVTQAQTASQFLQPQPTPVLTQAQTASQFLQQPQPTPVLTQAQTASQFLQPQPTPVLTQAQTASLFVET
ncbi:uncharacterized protein LOC142466367 [Ascaphus truei]|uniref:uncharacterized protein LOC142466367 n=1 Tax=Ascaphus truei TaxID=8439 RepID=UPI003F59DFDD